MYYAKLTVPIFTTIFTVQQKTIIETIERIIRKMYHRVG